MLPFVLSFQVSLDLLLFFTALAVCWRDVRRAIRQALASELALAESERARPSSG